MTSQETLFETLKARGPCTAHDLIPASGLSASQVYRWLQRWLEAGTVEVVGSARTKRKRPMRVYQVVEGAACLPHRARYRPPRKMLNARNAIVKVLTQQTCLTALELTAHVSGVVSTIRAALNSLREEGVVEVVGLQNREQAQSRAFLWALVSSRGTYPIPAGAVSPDGSRHPIIASPREQRVLDALSRVGGPCTVAQIQAQVLPARLRNSQVHEILRVLKIKRFVVEVSAPSVHRLRERTYVVAPDHEKEET